jgi:hypothetical protein
LRVTTIFFWFQTANNDDNGAADDDQSGKYSQMNRGGGANRLLRQSKNLLDGGDATFPFLHVANMASYAISSEFDFGDS